ncbi:hypothetical protein ACHQM5_015365 [Ranunculus cassubicifolius]
MRPFQESRVKLVIIGISEGVEDMAKDVLAVLQREQQNTAGVFIVKDIQCICADSMVVDISFNQHGGLCTLSFLEEHYTNKRWCYYESRILGAHHGLISTYALETMIIYIFQVFRTPPRGPLEVSGQIRYL